MEKDRNNMLESMLTKPELIVFVVGGIIGVVAIVAGYWSKVRRIEVEAGLKQDMIERGMSAEEIERVIRASAPSSRRASR